MQNAECKMISLCHFAFCILYFAYLQVIRILHRLVIGVFHQPGIAAEGISYNGLFRFSVFQFLHLLQLLCRKGTK